MPRIIFIALLMLSAYSNADINKCVVDGKTVYAEAVCPNNTQQPLDLNDATAMSSSLPTKDAPLDNDCVCKMKNESIFKPSTCPKVQDSNLIGEAYPGMWFESIPIRNLVGIFGDFSGKNVCIPSNLTSNVKIKTTTKAPWTEIIRGFVKENGYGVSIDKDYIYVYK